MNHDRVFDRLVYSLPYEREHVTIILIIFTMDIRKNFKVIL